MAAPRVVMAAPRVAAGALRAGGALVADLASSSGLFDIHETEGPDLRAGAMCAPGSSESRGGPNLAAQRIVGMPNVRRSVGSAERIRPHGNRLRRSGGLAAGNYSSTGALSGRMCIQ